MLTVTFGVRAELCHLHGIPPHNTVAALPAFCEKCNGPLDILDILLVFALTLGPARHLLICRVGTIAGTLAAVHLCNLPGSLLARTQYIVSEL